MNTKIKILERQFQDTVIELAQWLGWVVHAERPAWTSKGYRTPIQGTPGFPDLVLIRERVIFAELKADTGKLSEAQRQWQSLLTTANQEVYVWYPDDWESIKRILER